MSAAPMKRPFDARAQAKAAIKRRLEDKKAGKPAKKPYPLMKPRAKGY